MTTITVTSQLAPNHRAFNFCVMVGDRAPIRFKRTTNQTYGVYCILGALVKMNALPPDWTEVKIGAHNDAEINPLSKADFKPLMMPYSD